MRSWTSYFIGETKCLDRICYSILADGSVKETRDRTIGGDRVTLHATPTYANEVGISTSGQIIVGSGCNGSSGYDYDYFAVPVYSNIGARDGTAPQGWSVIKRLGTYVSPQPC